MASMPKGNLSIISVLVLPAAALVLVILLSLLKRLKDALGWLILAARVYRLERRSRKRERLAQREANLPEFLQEPDYDQDWLFTEKDITEQEDKD